MRILLAISLFFTTTRFVAIASAGAAPASAHRLSQDDFPPETNNLLHNFITQHTPGNAKTGTLHLRDLTVGDFDAFNALFSSATLYLPDTSIEQSVIGVDLTIDLSNLRCTNLGIGDVLITYQLESNQTMTFQVDIVDLDITCYLDYRYEWGFFHDNGSVDAYTENNDAKVNLALLSDDFQLSPPPSSSVTFCETTINISDLDVRGGVAGSILNTFEQLLRNTIESQIRTVACEELTTLGAASMNNYLTLAKDTLDAYLIDQPVVNALVVEQSLVIPESMNLLNFSQNSTSLLSGWFHKAVNVADGLLGKQTTTGEFGINTFLRNNFLDADGALIVNVSSFVDDVVLFQGSDKLTQTSIILDSVKIFGLDTFTRFEPLKDIGHYTLQSDFSWEYFTVQVELTIDIEPSTAPDSILSDPTSAGIVEQVTVSFGVDGVNATIALLLAIDEDILGNLELGPLLDSENLLPCLLSSLFQVNVSSFDVQVDNIREPVLTGFVSFGLDRVVSDTVEAAFLMYEATLVEALPTIFQTKIRTLVNEKIIQTYLAKEGTADCPLVEFASGPIDFRDLFLLPNVSLAEGGSGMAPYGNLGATIKTLLHDQLLTAGDDGRPKLNSFLVGPLTRSQSGTSGSLRFPDELFSVVKDDMDNPLVLAFIQRFRLEASDIRIKNLDTLTFPLTILDPSSTDPSVIVNVVNFGSVLGNNLNATMQLLWAIEGEDSPLDMRNVFDISMSIPSSSITADLRAMLDGLSLSSFPLKDLLNLHCWLAMFPEPRVTDEVFRRAALGAASPLSLTNFVMNLTDLNIDIECVSCNSPGVSVLSEVLQLQETMGSWTLLRKRVEIFVNELITSDWLQLQLDHLVSDAPMQCPHSPLYDVNAVATKAGVSSFPNLSRDAVETFVFAGGLGAELAILAFTETHLSLNNQSTDPLSQELKLDSAVRASSLNWTDLSGSIGKFADVALDEARRYLGGIVEDSSREDIGLNVLLRKYFLETDGTWTIALDDVGFVEAGLNVTLPSIRLLGLDTLKTANLFIPIGAQTVRNILEAGKLAVELDIVVEVEGEGSSPETITISIGLENLSLDVSLLLALDSNKIGDLQLGSILRTKDILPCVLAAVNAIEFTQITASAGAFAASITGFLSMSVQSALTASLDEMVRTYQDSILRAIPSVFQKTGRELFNRIIPAFITKDQNSVCPSYPLVDQSQLIDFRDLFLAKADALKAGASGNSPYGTLAVLVKDLLNAEFLGSGSDEGVSKINEAVIRPLTEAQSKINGTFLIDSEIAAISTDDAVQFGIETMKLALSHVVMSNLDTVGNPLVLLEPNYTDGSLLNNEASLGVGSEPLRGSLQLLLELTGDPALSMTNVMTVDVELSEVHAVVNLMIRMRENGLFKFPLRDITNLDCWLATLATPELDEDGFRIPGLDPGLAVEYLNFAAEMFQLNVTCLSCSSPGLASLPEVIRTLRAAGVMDELQPRLIDLSLELLGSSYVQTMLDRLVVIASQKCPHSPDFVENAANIKEYKSAGFPELSREALENVIHAASVVIESVAVLLAKSHENLDNSARDPLSGQKRLVVPDSIRLLDFTSLNDTIGSWADSAIYEANKYLGGQVDDIGAKDLGINVVMRSTLLDNDRFLPIIFENLEFNDRGMSIALTKIRISGLDTFTEFNAFDSIAPQTLQNKFGWKKLGIELDVSIKVSQEAGLDSRLLGSTETLTIAFGVEDVNLSLSMLLAMDKDILGSIKMGSMLKASHILPCLLSASKGAEITELAVSVGSIHGLSLHGFISEKVNQSISRTTDALLQKYNSTLINAIPAIFDVTVRAVANNWMLYYLNEETACSQPGTIGSKGGFVDIRDLLLPAETSRSLGGSGEVPYGDIFQSLLDIVKKQVLVVDETDGTSAVNRLLIAPSTKSQSSIPGTFRYEGDILNTGSRIVVGGFDAKIEFRAYDARIENLDSVGAPLSILDPVLAFPYNLNNTASFGVGEEPLRFAVRFLFSLIGDKNIRLWNEVDISLDLTAATVALETMLTIRESTFLNFPLRDIQNIQCWMSTLPAPTLDPKGIRSSGSHLSAALVNLAVSLKKLNLNITCISCSSPEMEDLSKLLATPEATDDATAVANTILDFATKLLGGEFLQLQIDRMLANAPARCPHNVAYDPAFSPAEFEAFEAVERSADSITFFVAIGIVMTCLILFVAFSVFVIRSIVNKRNKVWVNSISSKRVSILHQLQNAEQEKQNELNNATSSMFHSEDIPLWLRYFMPVAILANVGFFLSGHLNLGASVNIVAELAGEKITVENFFQFSIAQSTVDIWKAGGKPLAILILIFSGVWPYTKQFITLALWFLPPRLVSCTRRGSIFIWLDILAKWSIVDIFVLIVSITAFRVSVQSPEVGFLPDNFYSIDLLVIPKWGLYANMIAQLMTQILSHIIIHYHRLIVGTASKVYDRRMIGGSLEGDWNNDEEQETSPGSSVPKSDADIGNLKTHAFSRPHRGESDKLLVRNWVNGFLVTVSVILAILIVVGSILPSFSLDVLGIIGVVVESGQQFDQAISNHSVFTTVRMLMGEAKFLGGANNYIGLASLSILLILTVVVVPIVQALALLRQWFTPMTQRQRNRMSIWIESLQAWQYAEVFVIAILVASWQLGPVSEFMINSYCEDLTNTFATLVYFGVLSAEDAQCFRVQASIESATYILIVATVLLAFLNAFVMRAAHQYEFDNSAIVHQSLKYMAKTDEMSILDDMSIMNDDDAHVRAVIRPVPILFTDSFRWFCKSREDVDILEPRETLLDFDDDEGKPGVIDDDGGKLGIKETFAGSAGLDDESVWDLESWDDQSSRIAPPIA